MLDQRPTTDQETAAALAELRDRLAASTDSTVQKALQAAIAELEHPTPNPSTGGDARGRVLTALESKGMTTQQTKAHEGATPI